MIAIFDKKENAISKNDEDLKINIDDLTVLNIDAVNKEISLVSFKNNKDQILNVEALIKNENELQKEIFINNDEVKIKSELEKIEEVNILNEDETTLEDTEAVSAHIEQNKSRYRTHKPSIGTYNQSMISSLNHGFKDKKRKSLHPSEAFIISEEVLKASKLSISPSHDDHGHKHHNHKNHYHHRTSSESENIKINTDGKFKITFNYLKFLTIYLKF